MKKQKPQSGFGIIEILLIILVVVGLAAAGFIVYQHYHKSGAKNNAATNQTQTQQQTTSTTKRTQTDPYAGWQTFTDNASAGTSGISIKYPSDWHVNTTSTKAYAWSIGSTQAGIAARYVFLTTPQTAQQEWDTCATTISADACGAASGDKTVTGSESTINGLDAYTATMQSDSGNTYHVTVIRGNKSTSAGTPFVEFTTYTTDQTALNTFTAIMASATFPN